MTVAFILHWLKQHVASTAHLQLDSRDIRKGDVFVACVGTSQNGAAYIEDAIVKGAAVVLLEQSSGQQANAGYPVPVLAVPGLRQLLGELGDAWYGHPSEQVFVIAVTGTNGKTSCATWLARALTANGVPCATIGTLGMVLPDNTNLGGSLTTPDVLTLHRLLAELRNREINAVAIEASSIGLDQGRLDGLRIRIAAFSNLTLDHLDYHKDMAQYEQAKMRLFHWPGLQHAVINLDDPAGERMFRDSRAENTIGYSLKGHADAKILAKEHRFYDYGLAFDLFSPQGEAQVLTRLLGEHNISNLLLVAGVLQAMGWQLAHIVKTISLLEPVPGRLQIVKGLDIEGEAGMQPLVVVDYSHTPDSLERALDALRPTAQARKGRLICVFGCGGDRDKTKRPVMGKIASQKADLVYVTSDNPRTENPQQILADILAGMPGSPTVQPDRASAILQAVLHASATDVILVAGKGHETYQEVNHVKTSFDDREWSVLALALRHATGVSTDSRSVGKGQIFIALKGENFDAHDFLDKVQQTGALLAVVSRKNPDLDLPQVLVADTGRALELMGKAWRSLFDIPVIGVAGSNGKTTTKEMIASILAAHVGPAHCIATKGNLNNQIGVPLSLLELNKKHLAAVFELGMNHPGEIRILTDLARPTVGLVNNAQREHQEFMQTVEAVAIENADVIAGLDASGVAVFPADDPYTALWQKIAGNRRRILFGFGEQADVTAQELVADINGSRFLLVTPGASGKVSLNIPGHHNVRNALAATACALAIGIPLDTIIIGLQKFSPVKGRMQGFVLSDGTKLLDDSYNANPDSVRAAIDVLSQLPGSRVLVLGDMAEVGEDGPQMHAEVGFYAKEKGIDYLLVYGNASRQTAQAFGSQAKHFEDIHQMAPYIRTLKPLNILVKGSRSMRMERVIADLQKASSIEGEKDAV
ncbi:UDP-N-acetylmuramoyl-tripeptide--D-alanyl-D-alanine ligase [Advenella faeciporci]|uniref:Multifunctional fusion protein n=1 Tax=Advenella faeciporci TaxID=797535 RepID=A0A918JMP6_9BURK|nr:bifunctional UDP-N-acetylmuramoyl-L-alanyl-D-glutamate--2,6-diaminopimelate ligase MurE/UDP-N-acetylmuramoyl-tripeptide--D-alanyl-D-alanine ligase MurF [Advenella faeciporci]GGW90139.1 UDP-N-acetylmuramoyl-tripeptide--D-alanyl-D-alanine ligase [Advenella faeciporci]